jgi:hypothetical protein
MSTTVTGRIVGVKRVGTPERPAISIKVEPDGGTVLDLLASSRGNARQASSGVLAQALLASVAAALGMKVTVRYDDLKGQSYLVTLQMRVADIPAGASPGATTPHDGVLSSITQSAVQLKSLTLTSPLQAPHSAELVVNHDIGAGVVRIGTDSSLASHRRFMAAVAPLAGAWTAGSYAFLTWHAGGLGHTEELDTAEAPAAL